MAPPPPPQRKEIPAATALQVHPINSDHTLFTAQLAWDFNGGFFAFGGFTTSLMHIATAKYSLHTNPQYPQPDAITSHFQFLTPVLATSPVRLSVRSLKRGKGVSVLQVELQTPLPSNSKTKSESESWQTCILAIVTMGNLSAEKLGNRLSIPLPSCIPKSEMMDCETECEDVVHEQVHLTAFPALMKLHSRAKKGSESLTYKGEGTGTVDLWFRRGDGEAWDLDYLGMLVDFYGAAPTYFSPDRRDFKDGIRYPTLCMTVEIKKDPTGLKWLFLRSRTMVIRNGRFDMLVYVCDEEGDLVAFTKHVLFVAEGKETAGKSGALKRLYKL